MAAQLQVRRHGGQYFEQQFRVLCIAETPQQINRTENPALILCPAALRYETVAFPDQLAQDRQACRVSAKPQRQRAVRSGARIAGIQQFQEILI